MNNDTEHTNDEDEDDAEHAEALASELELPLWVSRSNPMLRAEATKLLRDNLREAQNNRPSTDNLWKVFQHFTRQYMYGEFLDEISLATHAKIKEAILAEDYDKLRAEAVKIITKKLDSEIRAELEPIVREALDIELRQSLRPEMTRRVAESLNNDLMEKLKPAVIAQLKHELKNDPALIAEVRLDLQQRILRALPDA